MDTEKNTQFCEPSEFMADDLPMTYKEIIDFIRQKRKERKITQEEIADHFDIGRQTYWAYENGSITPPSDKLVAIIHYLGYEIVIIDPSKELNAQKAINQIKEIVDGVENNPLPPSKGE